MSIAQPGVVAPWRATYVPGDWYVIAGPTSLVVLEPGQGRADMIGDLWADVVASSSMTDLIDRLAGYGITELPDLAVVFWSSAGMRTLVRGGVQLDDAATGEKVADGSGVVTWNEVGLENLESVRIHVREQEADGEELPLAVGVVRAGALRLRADEDAAVRSPQPLLRSAGAGPAGATDDHDRPAAGVAPAAATPVPEVLDNNDDDRADGQSADEQNGFDQGSPDAAARDDDTGPDFPPLDESDDPGATGSIPASGLDSPWGPQAPVAAGVGVGLAGVGSGMGVAGAGSADGHALEDQSVNAAEIDDEDTADQDFSGQDFSGPDFSEQDAGHPETAGQDADQQDTAAGGSTPDSSDDTPTEFSLDQFEMENDDTQLMASPVIVGPDGRLIQPGQPAPTGPTVEAVRCPQGHPNAPGSSSCRICRMEITASGSELVPEPLLARLRAADGTVVDLDRAVLLGRAPSEVRSTVSLPRLVTLASAAQDISRTHLQIAPDNWQILVTDLNSTNGTFVTDPGPDGNRGLLTPGQPTPVPIGAVLELGEGVTITIEPGD